jgi:hypothetical protein
MGIDIAVRAPHQASPANERGELLWSGHRFGTTAVDLDALWARLPAEIQAAEVTVVMEPTRNAWVPLAAWFRRRGARVVLVSAERSADLRAYYAKHTKAIDWILFCWPGFRCCTLRACMLSEVLGLVTRCGDLPRCIPRWSNAAPPVWLALMRSWRYWGQTGTRPWPLT